MMMGEYSNKIMMMKKKRKELEDDFSLSSPATKIRRLDAELAPIMEEDEPRVMPVFEEQHHLFPLTQVGAGSGSSVIIEELPQQNDERAIVLFNPINTHLAPSFSVSSHILAGLKKQGPWSNQSRIPQNSENKAEEGDVILQGSSNECLAVVPWVQSQIPHNSQQTTYVEQPDTSEMMEGEEMDTASMDIEGNYAAIEQTPANEFVGAGSGEGIHQWQQHCMVPQLQIPQNASQPIVWFQ